MAKFQRKCSKLYHTILIDPPWKEQGAGSRLGGGKRGADRHYPLLKTSKIIKIIKESDVFTPAENCHLYLWVTNNFLPDGLKVMKELGFRYITNIAWIKDKFGLGFYFRGQHELCLFGTKGIILPQYKDFEAKTSVWRRYHVKRWSGAINKSGVETPTTVIMAKRKRHSQKPLKMYKLIETVSMPPRLEMFARDRREGWDSWGNEVSSSLQKILVT